VAEHRGGMFTMSPDGRFVLGSVPDVPGLWVASGCNGSGFSSSPALGEGLAGQITGASASDTSASDTSGELAALSPGRFGPYSDNALIAEGVWQYEHYYEPQGYQP
jgi:4-methylaminobutanoate oxidase (formaldehyde-forming)